jgi:fructokinase
LGKGSYAVVIGEALVDLIEAPDHTLRPVPGGSPLNVAVGIARLGTAVEFLGSFGTDGFGKRLREFLVDNGVAIEGSVQSEVQTALAVTTFEGSEPSYSFYGQPRSYGRLRDSDLDTSVLHGSKVIHAGSIGLLEAPMYEAVEAAYATPGPLRTLDPNVRLSMIEDIDAFRTATERLFALVDLVKLSLEDSRALYDGSPADVAGDIARLGPRFVIMTRGAEGVLAWLDDSIVEIPGRAVAATDTTGAGDSFMAAVISEVVGRGVPADAAEWQEVLEFAIDVSALTCCSPGGATAIPTRNQVAERFGPRKGS